MKRHFNWVLIIGVVGCVVFWIATIYWMLQWGLQ